MPECDAIDGELGDGSECREKAGEAGMKREVIKRFRGFRSQHRRIRIIASCGIFNRELLKLRELAVEYDREEGEWACSGVEGVSNEYDFVDVFA